MIQFDEKGFPIRGPKKFLECENQVSKNDYAIMQLQTENRVITNDRYKDPNSPENQQKIKDNEQKIRKLERENEIRERCHEVNRGCYDVACSQCETLPVATDKVKRAVKTVPSYKLHITGA